jgi:glycosyltransferase involved in cell wall biosynthesis
VGDLPDPRETSGALRVVLVDPSSRGGIATYTRLVARALRLAGVEAEILASVALELADDDLRIERRLPADRWGKPDRAGPGFYLRRILTWYGSVRAIRSYLRRRRPDVVHFQAPLNRRFDALLLRRLHRRVAVVWTAHDVLPFEQSERDPDWFAAIYGTVDRVVVHTALAAEAVRSLAGVDPAVIAHPVPDDIVRTSRLEARRSLDLPEEGRIAAALGFIRPYKGYGLLADVWESLGEDAPRLLVLGELLADTERPVIERLEKTGRADVRLGYASDRDLQLAVAASDMLLLPYVDASESGLLHLSRALGVPVIASDTPELAAAVTSSAAGVAIPRTVDAWSAAVTGQLIPPPPAPPDLESVGRAHLAVYREVLAERGRSE